LEPDDDLGGHTNISELRKEAKELCFDGDRNEVLDALYTLSREHAAPKLSASQLGRAFTRSVSNA
jgi:hypothetical protein